MKDVVRKGRSDMDASSANIETRNGTTRDVYHSTLVAHSRRARRGAGVYMPK